MAGISGHFPILIVVVPLMGAVLTPIIGYWRRKLCMPWAALVMLLTFVMTAFLGVRLSLHGPISYHLGSWEPPFGIEIYFDYVATLAFVMALFGFLVIIFSRRYVEKKLEEVKIPTHYTLLLLILAGMIGFVVTRDMFNLFVFLEIVSLSGYALIAIGGEKLTAMAAFKYLLVGAISSLSVLLGIAFLYSITGTLNMKDMSHMLTLTDATRVASVALALFIVGFAVKAAMFPLHIWLPDAHALAPSPVSALLSGLVVKTGIVGMIRVLFDVYRISGPLNYAPILNIMAWLAGITIVLGAFFAFFQNDIKMMFAYSTISNIGYIVMGLSLASYFGLIGGLIHVFNHALIKTTLFLCAGAIIYKTGHRKLADLQGIGRKMPITMGAIVIAAVSIVGIPPTAGFICKWFIILGTIEAGKPVLAGMLLLGSLFIVAYYVKIINAAFFREPVHEITEVDEAPASMLVPIVILAIGCLLMGVFAYAPLTFIRPAVTAFLK